MPESYIKTSFTHTTFVGPDATQLFATAILHEAILLYLKCGMLPNARITPADLRKRAEALTKQTYPRGKPGLTAAAAALEVWINNMRSALPEVKS